MIATSFFTDFSSFDSLEKPLNTSCQGMYLVVLFNLKWKTGFRLYVGSSYGKQGLEHRVFKNHGMESYRKREEGKYLYQLMARSGTTWHFIALAVFETAVPQSLVLIAEAIMSSLFSPYAHEV